MKKQKTPAYPFQRTAILRDAGFETREDGEERIIEGYFAVFDGIYPMWDKAYERIDPHAFDETLSRDIRALTNHDDTLVLGRTSAGTLTLSVDERGLFGRIVINGNDQDAVNTYERVKRRDVSQCSFGFDIAESETIEHEDGTVEYVILKVVLYEVSVVTFPAYEDTAVEARHADYEAKKLAQWRAKITERLKGVRKDA